MATLTPLQRAFLALEDTRSRLERVEREPIAIVGMSCRTAGDGDSPDALWRIFRDGVDTIGRVPAARWDADAWYGADASEPGRIVTTAGGFLASVDGFDCDLFGIAPREARGMDPQQRLFLEVAWEALEDAGLAPDRLRNSSTGVYLGICSNDYLQLLLQAGDPALVDAHFMSGNAHSIASGRLSYLLGLQGPSLSIDTACSSSLVAVHLACQALRAGECRLALAGGVSLMLSPENFVAYSRAGLLAPDGRCKTFDAAADGIGRAEGCGVVALKRLSDAVADGDRILALVRGSAVNQDGPSGSLTAPNGPAQEAVIRAALGRAGLSPHEIGCVEAHGTGTPLGDPMEMRALGAVFGPGRPAASPLWVGSAKTNLGHLEAAAGIIGLLKLVLSLRHRELPPHLHLSTPSPHIAWADLPVRVPQARTPWASSEGPLRGGVSSFGFSGTNAHIVVEEAPGAPPRERPADRSYHLLTLSAARESTLATVATRLHDRLGDVVDGDLADVAFTLNTGRAQLPVRAAVIAASVDEARRELSSVASGATAARRPAPATRPRVGFLFTGQGSQRIGMGRELHATSRTYREAFDACAALLDAHLPAPLAWLLDADPSQAHRLDATDMAQPALFAVEYALAVLWRRWGVEPVAVLGHSVGDVAAACVAGVLSLADACALVAARGALMQRTAPGSMRAVFASRDRVAALLPADSALEIAAVNAPEHVVVSGPSTRLAAWAAMLEAHGLRSQPLHVTRAFHSAAMEPVLDAFEAALAPVAFHAPQLRVVSSLTGALADAAQIATTHYWREHARRPVRFADGVTALASLRCDALVEIGPAPVLLALAQHTLGAEAAAWCPSLKPGRDEWATLLESVRALHLLGVPIDWAAFDRDYPRRRQALPTYPFERQRCWFVAGPTAGGPRRAVEPLHPLLGRRVRSPLPQAQFEAVLAAGAPAFIADHNVGGSVLLPATAGVELALAAGREIHGARVEAVEAMVLREAMTFDEDEARIVQTTVEPPVDGIAVLRVQSTKEAPVGVWTLHYEARLRIGAGPATPPPVDSPARVAARCGAPESSERLYADQRVQGFLFGPRLQGVRTIRRGDGEALGEIELPEAERAVTGPGAPDAYCIHPALLDACVQVMGGALPEAQTRGADADVYVPVGIRRVRVFGSPGTRCTSHVIVGAASRPGSSYDLSVRIFAPDGALAAEIEGLELQRVSAETRRRLGHRPSDLLHELRWQDADQQWSPRVRVAAATDATPASWLVLADRGGVGAALATHLRARGHECALVDGDGQAAPLPSLERDDTSVIDARWLDAPEWPGAPDPGVAVSSLLGRSLDLVRWLVTSQADRTPRLCVVTRGAQAAGEAATPVSVLQAAAWGFGRSLALEHPELRARLVDLDPASDPDAVAGLAEELVSGAADSQVALRAGRRLVPRLVRHTATDRVPEPLPTPSYTVDPTPTGLDHLHVRACERVAPAAGEVEIAVAATGLNFRDVLNVLGMYPGEAGPIGAECAGVVTRVGTGVAHVAPGDEVVATARACFSGHVVTRHEMVHALPHGCTLVEGAALPIGYLTAAWSLLHLAHLAPGERVLIHAGAGGVGLAAVHLALRAGARVFATAGSDAKRRYLASLGVEQALDSRTPAFADHLLAATGGHGADVVLNSLADDFVAASFRATADGGRFVEIGKRGIWTHEQVARLERSITYHIVDLGTADRTDTVAVGELLGRLMADVGSGALPKLPVTVFGIDDLRPAFAHMMQARHVGKIVVTHRRWAPPAITGDAAYLVTGGLSGVGLEVARWLADQGARRLVLASRRGVTADASGPIAALRARGVEVSAVAIDVTDEAALAALLDEARAAGRRLGGIVHAAGVIDDGAILNLDQMRCARVAAPKVTGAARLERLTSADQPDFVIACSSMASVLGSAGQSSYAAANAVLDAWAHERRRLGLGVTSVNWGPWRDTGMAARQAEAGRGAHPGVTPLPTDQALRALGDVLALGAGQVCAVSAEWPRVARSLDASGAPMLARLVNASDRTGHASARSQGPALLALLADAPAGRRPSMVSAFVRDRVAHVLGIRDAEAIDARVPLGELGLDSLLAVELRNTLAAALATPLPATLLFDHSTVERLTRYLSDEVLHLDAGARDARDATHADGDLLAGIAGLSDEEVERRLATLQERTSE